MLRYSILIVGLASAGFFIWSIYAFAAAPEDFKTAVSGFLGTAILFFILVIMRKVRDDRLNRKKKRQFEKDPDALRKRNEAKYKKDFRR